MTSNSDPNKKTPSEILSAAATDTSTAAKDNSPNSETFCLRCRTPAYIPYSAETVKSKPNWLWVLPLLLVVSAYWLICGPNVG